MGQDPPIPKFRREAADYAVASGIPKTKCCRKIDLNS